MGIRLQRKTRSSGPISSGSLSLDKLLGGGLQPGYPWLFVTDLESEGITISAIGVVSFDFALRDYPVFIMAIRDTWGISMERYQHTMPKTYKKLKENGERGGVCAINFLAPPGYKSRLKYEKCLDLETMPYQTYEKIVDVVKNLKMNEKPIFWRLSSISELAHHARYYGDEGVIDMLKPLLGWLQTKGATGIASINRARTSEKLMNEMVSLFPNVIYVNTELGKTTKYFIQVAKSASPIASTRRMQLKVTPKYKIMIKP